MVCRWIISVKQIGSSFEFLINGPCFHAEWEEKRDEKKNGFVIFWIPDPWKGSTKTLGTFWALDSSIRSNYKIQKLL